ncbi:Crotonobetainyl-CoA dehydrogenase [Cyphellophora attinorum]|uniref:Crotonobetainyl-CoA dehydrogenase n=1 Tax=Cyphellophora attinorum TaxID=1664694 RepID=A0A0N1NYW2_9EURO|nr:Crotonobetainyl-CoA dehydrogenase [Phialophora attinorum]KPI40902.1 Crotonobetainyl-CoA dehydrogenase [Phialophora attinorum]
MPLILKFAEPELQNRISKEVLSGQKRMCLCITEPGAGSDVQGIATEAVVSEDGSSYILNGEKKWITSGMYSDYFVTLARTSPTAMSLFVVPKGPGVNLRHMYLAGSSSAGTAYVEFDDVQVPIENRIGEEGDGLKAIMSNFNHERLYISMESLRLARICHEDSASYLLQREAFGRKLVEQPIVRFRFAHMARETEALQAWVESLIYQSSNMTSQQSDLLLAGQTAQLKAHAGIVLENVASSAVQLLGGLGLTKGGRGERIERIWRDLKGNAIPGGSTDVLLDWSVKRAFALHKAMLNKSSSAKL